MLCRIKNTVKGHHWPTFMREYELISQCNLLYATTFTCSGMHYMWMVIPCTWFLYYDTVWGIIIHRWENDSLNNGCKQTVGFGCIWTAIKDFKISNLGCKPFYFSKEIFANCYDRELWFCTMAQVSVVKTGTLMAGGKKMCMAARRGMEISREKA